MRVDRVRRIPPLSGLLEAVRKRGASAELRRFACRHRLLALTFDDGPSTNLTRGVLDVLGRYQVRATFFLLGRRVAMAPEVVNEIAGAGHEIGCHGYAHLHAWRVSPDAAVEDIEHGYEVLGEWIPPDALFRPAHGKLVARTRRMLARRRAPIGWWTLDSGDTWPVRPRRHEIVRSVRDNGGGVVLLHDFERTGTDRDAVHDYVLGLTEELILEAKRENIRICPLGELMKHGLH